MGAEIRPLAVEDIANVRRLQALAPSKHLLYTISRFPRYFEAIGIVDPPSEFLRRQCHALGLFENGGLVGTIALERMKAEAVAEPAKKDRVDEFCREFTEHDALVFDTLNASLLRTYIGAPDGSYVVHSLHVHPQFRRRGFATELMKSILNACAPEQRENLYLETAREKHLQVFIESFGFRCIKRTVSLSERLEYGTWGSLLFRYTEQIYS